MIVLLPSMSAICLAPSRGNLCYQHLVYPCRDISCIYYKQIHKSAISLITFTIKKDYFPFEEKVVEDYFMMWKDKRKKSLQNSALPENSKSSKWGSLCQRCQLSMTRAGLDFGPGAFSPAFGEGLWELPGNSLDPPCTNGLLPTLGHCLPSRAHLENSFRASVRTHLAVPGPAHTRDLRRGNYCHLKWLQVWGIERCFIHSPAGERTVQLHLRVCKHNRRHMLEAYCPVSSAGAHPLPGDREGRSCWRADESRGGKLGGTRSWRPWDPVSALTFPIDVSWDEFLISAKSSHFS